MRPNTRFAAITIAGLLAVPLIATPATAREPVPSTVIKPGALERGADIGVPFVRRSTIVDGDVRVTLTAPFVRLVGTAGADYVVHIANADRTNPRIVRITPAGKKTKLLRGIDGNSVRLSTDGERLTSAYAKSGDQTVVKVWSATTGVLDVKKSFDGVLSVLDFSGPELLLGGSGPAAHRAVRRGQPRDRAGLEPSGVRRHDGRRPAGDVHRDPYAGGCTVVTKLSKPGVELWRSCRQRVDAFSPAGKRMATIALLADGVGPDVVRVLASRGGRWRSTRSTAGSRSCAGRTTRACSSTPTAASSSPWCGATAPTASAPPGSARRRVPGELTILAASGLHGEPDQRHLERQPGEGPTLRPVLSVPMASTAIWTLPGKTPTSSAALAQPAGGPGARVHEAGRAQRARPRRSPGRSRGLRQPVGDQRLVDLGLDEVDHPADPEDAGDELGTGRRAGGGPAERYWAAPGHGASHDRAVRAGSGDAATAPPVQPPGYGAQPP